MHIHPLISDSATLANLCARMADADYVCVDTEFMRESTYYPELCLIQIADDKEAAAIDPMAPGIDLKPLLDLRVEQREGRLAGQVVDDLDVLPAGMNHLQHVVILDEKVE